MHLRRILNIDGAVGLTAGLMLPAMAGCSSAIGFHGPESQRETPDFSPVDRAAAARGRVSEDVPVRSSALELELPYEPTAPTVPDARSIRFVSDESVDPATPKERRIVIYNAGLRIVVKEVEAAIRQTEALAAEFGGYVQGIRSESITIRVPVARYSDAVARVEDLGRVIERQLDAADVTEEYVDLEARLKNAKAVRDRLKALLDRAEDVKAALEVEKELKRVGEEIERLEAKLELIKSRVAFCTISATFERVYRTPPSQQIMKLPFRWLRELDPQRLAREDW